MSNIFAIFRRELRAYFDSPLAYIIVPIFLGLIGVFCLFFQDIFEAGLIDMRTVFFWMAFFYLLLIPAVTMRSFTEESRTGSLEMLVTLPISEGEMVLGKYLASFSLVLITLILSLTYPISLSQLGDLDWGPVLGGYLGLGLLGGAFCSIGIAMSALTNSQVIAFLLSFTIGMLPFATGYALNIIPADLLPVVQYMTFEYHFSNLAKGVLDSRNIIYYISIVAVFLHIAVFRLELRRLT
jgi:ABC-2 type transport system permease protein